VSRVKNILTSVTDFFIYSNLLISIGAFVFTLQTALFFNYSAAASAFFGLTNFVSTFVFYNLQRLYQSTKTQASERLNWYRNHRRVLFTLMFVFISLYFLVFKVNLKVFAYGLILYVPVAILSIFYFMPPFALRRLPFIKIFFISLVWTISGVLLPLLYNEYNFSIRHLGKEEYAYVAAQFLFIAAICIPFDIRDSENDRYTGVRTLVITQGISQAKSIGIMMLLGYMSLSQNTTQLLVYVLCGLPAIALLIYSATHRHRYYYSVLVDGLIVLQFLLSLLFMKGR
jgi:hypothetical protein